ncbi:MAG: ATP synthase F0 subunit C [Phycisphaerales bacterium]|nr:MAG: ATP synthase F0 subunit C [Phycisphaerales bacterium]
MRITRGTLALTLIAAGLLLSATAPARAAEEEAPTDQPAVAPSNGGLLDSIGAKGIGGGIGVGLVVMGGAAGIGRIGGSAVESMARQPEVAGQISTAMIITAAMIEGATLFAVLGCFIALV